MLVSAKIPAFEKKAIATKSATDEMPIVEAKPFVRESREPTSA
jgi:hypothetical protein